MEGKKKRTEFDDLFVNRDMRNTSKASAMARKDMLCGYHLLGGLLFRIQKYYSAVS